MRCDAMRCNAMFNVQCAMCNVQCAMCNVQCAMCNVQCAMCNVQCAMFNVQCAMCNVQCDATRCQKFPGPAGPAAGRVATWRRFYPRGAGRHGVGRVGLVVPNIVRGQLGGGVGRGAGAGRRLRPSPARRPGIGDGPLAARCPRQRAADFAFRLPASGILLLLGPSLGPSLGGAFLHFALARARPGWPGPAGFACAAAASVSRWRGGGGSSSARRFQVRNATFLPSHLTARCERKPHREAHALRYRRARRAGQRCGLRFPATPSLQ